MHPKRIRPHIIMHSLRLATAIEIPHKSGGFVIVPLQNSIGLLLSE